MSLTPDEAAQSLRAVADTQRRSTELSRYRHSAPFFFWWGAYWVLGYGATALWPERAGMMWDVLTVVAVAGHIAIARLTGKRSDWRMGALWLIGILFIAGTFAILTPFSGPRMGTFIPLLMGAIYAAAGVFFGARYIATGAVVAAATLFGFFFLREYFAWWMAAVGGGSLILTGLWLRQA